MPARPDIRYTFEDDLSIPEDRAHRYEIIGGELFVTPTPVLRHLAFVRTDRLGILDQRNGILGPPDLVVEVLSPSNRDYDRTLKRKRYMASGVAELWIVDADEDTLEVWRPGMRKAATPRDGVTWRVGDRTCEIALADILRR